jgi:hypothetical protein
MSFMKKSLIVASLVIAVVASTGQAGAQIVSPGTSPAIPLPPPPPGPRIEVPKVPKLDELPSRNYVPGPRPSFSDKITTCLEEGAAGGLGPGDREAYARACANSR